MFKSSPRIAQHVFRIDISKNQYSWEGMRSRNRKGCSKSTHTEPAEQSCVGPSYHNWLLYIIIFSILTGLEGSDLIWLIDLYYNFQHSDRACYLIALLQDCLRCFGNLGFLGPRWAITLQLERFRARETGVWLDGGFETRGNVDKKLQSHIFSFCIEFAVWPIEFAGWPWSQTGANHTFFKTPV